MNIISVKSNCPTLVLLLIIGLNASSSNLQANELTFTKTSKLSDKTREHFSKLQYYFAEQEKRLHKHHCPIPIVIKMCPIRTAQNEAFINLFGLQTSFRRTRHRFKFTRHSLSEFLTEKSGEGFGGIAIDLHRLSWLNIPGIKCGETIYIIITKSKNLIVRTNLRLKNRDFTISQKRLLNHAFPKQK